MMNDLKPGVYSPEEIPMQAYVADPCPEPALSKGIIKELITRTAKHAWQKHARFGGSSTYSHRADIGSSAHSMLFGGATIHYLTAEYGPKHKRCGETVDDFKTKAAQDEKAEAMERGDIPMLECERGMLENMRDIAKKVLEQFGPGKFEQTIVWKEGGVWHKTRPDFITDDHLVAVDYKTATNADPISWVKTSFLKGGYDIQGALGLRGLSILHDDAIQRQFVFMVHEITEPHAISFLGLDPETEEHAYEEKIKPARDIWLKCLDSNEWPAYRPTLDNIHSVGVQSYDRYEHEERKLQR